MKIKVRKHVKQFLQYIAASTATKEAVWLTYIFKAIKKEVGEPIFAFR